MILDRLNNALAIQINCLCPTEILSPLSDKTCPL
jgi:hypothetical protein